MQRKQDKIKEALRQGQSCCHDETEEGDFCFLEEDDKGYKLFRQEKERSACRTVQQPVMLSGTGGATVQGAGAGLCESLFAAAVFLMEEGEARLTDMNEAMRELQERGVLRVGALAGSEVFCRAAAGGHSACGELPVQHGQELRPVVYCLPVVKNGKTEKMLTYVWCMDGELSDLQTCLKTLTPREREIIILAAKGVTNKYIAQHLCVSEGTVKKALYYSYRKLNVGSRFDLIRLLHQKELPSLLK